MLYRDTQHAGLVHLLVHPFGDNVAKIEELLAIRKQLQTHIDAQLSLNRIVVIQKLRKKEVRRNR